MSSVTVIPELERILFFDGQRLRAGDLTEAQRALRELRWLHNRSLHSWGIAFGLSVAGRKGDAEVVVGPGYAIDCQGREILLVETQSLRVPAVSAAGETEPPSYFLTVSYPEEEALVVTERRAGVCAADGATRLAEKPTLRWLLPHKIRVGLDVILCQAFIKDCRLARALSFEHRRSARPAQPYVAGGQTSPTDTPWEAVLDTASGAVVGFVTQVDTSTGRFNTTPSYQANLLGGRLQTWAGVMSAVDGFVRVLSPRRESFRLEVSLPQGTLAGGVLLNPSGGLTESTAHTLGWHVAWMGVEGL